MVVFFPDDVSSIDEDQELTFAGESTEEEQEEDEEEQEEEDAEGSIGSGGALEREGGND